MTSYNILKPIVSKVLGTNDSGIINVNPSNTGNETVDNLVNEMTSTEIETLLASESIEVVA